MENFSYLIHLLNEYPTNKDYHQRSGKKVALLLVSEFFEIKNEITNKLQK